MIEWVHQLLQWVAAHPHLSGLVVLFIAFSESLAGLGLLVPGALMMFGVGALVAAGALEFWPVYLWSVLGAVAGDGLSYWLGRHFQEQIRVRWPFSRHPELLEKGQVFFDRHGGKSVFLGRFIGPIRPVIPVVAGMLEMPPARFYGVNLLSALGWAPVYLLPGMAFGASLALAGQVAGRLAILLVLLVVLVWSSVRLSLGLYRWLSPRAAGWARDLLRWGRRHPVMARLIDSLLDPDHPATPGLLLAALALVASVWLFLGVAEDVLTGDPLVQVDHTVYHLLQGLRNPWGDRIMVGLTELGDRQVILPVVAAVLAWLLLRRAWRSALYWLVAVGSGVLLVGLIKVLFRVPRPVELYAGISNFSFPSGHAAMSMVIYGFLAFLASRNLRGAWRWIPFALAAVLVTGVGLSRIYLGAHWASDILGGYGLGLAWISFLGIAYHRHGLPRLKLKGVGWVGLATFSLAACWHIQQGLGPDLARYSPRLVPHALAGDAWWEEEGWRRLPAWRLDLEGEHEQPLNIQYAGDLDALRRLLAGQGWRPTPAPNVTNLLHWLEPVPDLASVPLLPRVHDGRHESLRLERADGADHHLQVLRLWSSGYTLDGHRPLWVGTLDAVGLRSVFGDLHLPYSYLPRVGPAEQLGALPGVRTRQVSGPAGPVLLIRLDRGDPVTVVELPWSGQAARRPPATG